MRNPAWPTGRPVTLDLSLVIVNWNTKELLLACLQSLATNLDHPSHEIWLVDNASSDGSVEAVAERFPEVKIIRNERNLGFAAANNKALRLMHGRYALLLNTDTIVTPGAIQQLYRFLEENPRVGMAGGQLLNRDGSKQNSIANFPTIPALLVNETILRLLWPTKYPSKRQRYLEPLAVDSCIGACLMVRKAAMDEVGGLDERYFFYFEETDWARAMAAQGWGVYFVPSAEIFHLQGQTAGYSAKTRIMFYRSRNSYFKKWHPRTYRPMVAVVFARLLVNLALNLLHALITLGLNRPARRKLAVYGQLIFWHLRGCPEK